MSEEADEKDEKEKNLERDNENINVNILNDQILFERDTCMALMH